MYDFKNCILNGGTRRRLSRRVSTWAKLWIFQSFLRNRLRPYVTLQIEGRTCTKARVVKEPSIYWIVINLVFLDHTVKREERKKWVWTCGQWSNNEESYVYAMHNGSHFVLQAVRIQWIDTNMQDSHISQLELSCWLPGRR